MIREAVEGARKALSGSGTVVGQRGGGTPRFELFHAANSICSQKVRTVMAYHALPYRNSPVDLFLGETYLPEYVRLRMIGCQRLGGALVSHHSGSTSTSAGGCDSAVVPTLIDWDLKEVLVDSKRICRHLDQQLPEAGRLRPSYLATVIDRQLQIVDHLPNYQLLMSRAPSASEGATTRGSVGGSLSTKKVAWCDRYLRENAAEPGLVAAYTAKRSKELSAADTLFSAAAMKIAYNQTKAALHELEVMLEGRDGRWLFGHDLTMADLFWGIELLRMENLGVGTFWEEGKLPHVERYVAAAKDLPAIRLAIIEWPGALF